jgi:uncharacterized protein (DUF1919 family)
MGKNPKTGRNLRGEVRTGKVKKFVKNNETLLKSISPKRDWVSWIRTELKKKEPKKIMKGKVIVPDSVPGTIKQKKKNLTDYGKQTLAHEPDSYDKEALQRNWTIVSDNCYGVAYMKALGKYKQQLGKPKETWKYASPFFSMYIMAPDYITLLENFDEYMKIKPVAQKPINKDDKYSGRSRWHSNKRGGPYKHPVLLLKGSQGDVELLFAHEKQSPQEAIRKWEERKSRMNMDKKDMFVKMDSRDRFTIEIGQRFLALKQFPHKRLFLNDIKKFKKNFEGLKNVVFTDTSKDGAVIEKRNPVTAKGSQ